MKGESCMADVYQIVGKESRSYLKDGVQKFYNGLHLVSEGGAKEGCDGSFVTTVSCPYSVDASRLKVGEWVQLHYDHIQTQRGLMAKLVDITHYDET